MFSTSDLIEPLARRGIKMRRSQVYRLVADTLERVQVSLLHALCNILGCQLTEIGPPARQGRPQALPPHPNRASDETDQA